jgi:PD-(D/E)XK nuclease superfamily
MIVTYFRSSSYNTHSLCEQQYFLEYVLGYRGPSGQKADKGTIVHKVLEILAVIKKAEQDGIKNIDDDVIGKLDISTYSLNTIIEKVYKHYSEANPHHKWALKDYKDCHAWVYKAIEFNSGMFDPRNRHILCPEQHFDIEIKKPWSAYSYDTTEGKIEGNLAIKGTIDLITLVSDNTIEIVDWKTGRRLDWATGQEKTLEKLQNDPQLRIYHYAISHLYPHIDHIIFSIYFINDGGPFSICFDKSDLPKTEEMLRQKFEIVKNTRKPKLHKSWMCTKLCHFGKTTFDNTHITPQIEYRENQTCNMGSTMTKCEQVKHDIDLHGMNAVVEQYKNQNHSFGKYKAPGSTE